jgi:uncharacterized membrane protein YdjX (TVP38/TMEM64 family)
MSEIVHSIGTAIQGLGAWGYPLAVGLMAAVAVLPIPAEIPAAMNGMLFGPLGGIAVTWLGAMGGAWLSFELSRRFGRGPVERILPTRTLERIDGAVDLASWPGLLVARLVPAIAFTALNWGLGLTLCRRRTFLWTTALGILPGTVLFVFSGEGLARLYARQPVAAVALVAALSVVFLAAADRRKTRESASGRPKEGSVR